MNVGRRDIKTTLQIGSVVALAVIVAGATIIIGAYSAIKRTLMTARWSRRQKRYAPYFYGV
jgi:hypothetical protein